MTEAFTGFSQRWADFPDYIIGITKEIWEDRGLATLHDYYADDVVMRFPSGILRGNQTVINGTMATIAEFPDRVLLAEDVIWSGDAETGYLSSHRVRTSGTHTGFGAFGEPTGKRFDIRVIADCAAKSDTIYDEWLVRDYGGMARQLGLDPQKIARDQINDGVKPFTPADDVDGGYHGTGNTNEWGAKYADILQRIMAADLAVIPREYDRACHLHHAGARDGLSHADADIYWTALRSSFPSATFAIHHQIGRDDAMMPPRAAIRWSLTGKHDGWGMFGPPTGAPVHIMGISHAEFGPWGLRHETTLYDEVSIWKQITLHTG